MRLAPPRRLRLLLAFVATVGPTLALFAPTAGAGDPPVVPTVSVSDVSVVEGNSGIAVLTFSVSLSEPTTESVTMQVASSDGSATIVGNDYQAVSLSLTFIPGAVGPAQIVVPVNGDTAVEPDETVQLSVSNVNNATVADGTGLGTILNDDVPPVVPTVSVGDATVIEGDAGSAFLRFNVSLSEPTTEAVTMQVASSDGSATIVGNDYQTVSLNLTFIPGAVGPAQIVVPVNGDTAVEPDETVQLSVSNVNNATVADGTGVGTIDNDDAVVAVDETSISVVEGDAGTTDAVIEGVLSHPLATDLDLPATLTPGTASAGVDYDVPPTGTLHIPAGSTSGTLAVPVIGDTDIEPDETFTASFELPEPQPLRRAAWFASAVTVGGTLVVEVTIVDDDAGTPTTTTTTTTPAGPTTTTVETTSTTTGSTTSTTIATGTLPATRWRG